MRIVTFDEAGLAVSISDIPANMRLIDDDTPVYAEGRRLALLPDGSFGTVWDLRGHTCYGGESGRVGTAIPMKVEYLGKSWDDLALETSEAHPYGLLREPRAETAAEKKAREKAEAEAAAAREAERRANRKVSAVQIRLAANELGVRNAIETVVADPETPQEVKDYWEYSAEYHRASPVWAVAAPLISATDEMIDQLFDVAETK